MEGVFTSKGIINKAFIGRRQSKWCLWEHSKPSNQAVLLEWWDSLEECLDFVYPNPITYHRPPTKAEMAFGYGATHYKDFNAIDCTHPNGQLKKWFICPIDGLRYYR